MVYSIICPDGYNQKSVTVREMSIDPIYGIMVVQYYGTMVVNYFSLNLFLNNHKNKYNIVFYHL